MNRKVYSGDEYRDALKRGVDILANAVKVTLGARGRNVAIEEEYGEHRVTKDGVSVAEEIFLKDPIENLGAQMVKEVASKTGEVAGDGTTTSTVLAQAIINEGFKNIAAGASPIELKRGIDIATEEVISHLKSVAVEVKDEKVLKQVASISANNDEELGALIASTYSKIGNEGVVTVEPSDSTDTTVDLSEGMKVDGGYTSPQFITNTEKQRVELINPYVLVADQKISTIHDILPVLEGVIESNSSLLIVADSVEGEALSTLVFNKLQGRLKVASIKLDNFGERKKAELEDIALLTGATVASEERGLVLAEVNPSVLGKAKKIVIDKNSTTIIGGSGTTEDRIKELRSQLEDTVDKHDKNFIKERLAKLIGGVAVIKVGAKSEVEMKEKRDRVDDAVFATKASMEEGIVAGGGIALFNASLSMNDKKYEGDVKTGYNIIKKSILEPLKTIVGNAGISGDVVIDNLIKQNKNKGYDVKGDKYVDMIKSGIIDPVKVTRVALENAASVAGTMLTTETVIVRDDQGG